MLDSAIAALKKNDLDTALTELISLWRKTRSSALGDVIDQLSAKVPAQRPPIEGRTRGDQLAQWFARAKKRDAGDLTMLINSMFDFAPEEAWSRIKALETFGADPRLTLPLMRWFRRPPRGYWNLRMTIFWGAVVSLLNTVKDPRVSREAEALRDAWQQDTFFVGRREFAQWSENLVTASAEWKAQEQSVDLSPLLPWLFGRASPPKQSVDVALDAVYQNPNDLGLRQVCADVLSESGDARGEFIALQLAGRLKQPQRERMTTLLKQVGASLLGPLDDVVVRRELRFANGFPIAARLKVQRREGTEKNRAIGEQTVGLPQWSTFEALDVRDWLSPARALIEAESMRSLKRLFEADASVLSLVRPLPLEVLSIREASSDAMNEAFFEGETMPRLRELHFKPNGDSGPWGFERLWSLPLMQRLETVSAVSGTRPVEDQYELLVRAPQNVRTIILMASMPLFFHLRFERAGARWRGSIWLHEKSGWRGGDVDALRGQLKQHMPLVDLEVGEQIIRAMKL